MRSDHQIEDHMWEQVRGPRGSEEGPFFLACFNTALTFVDEADGAYSRVDFCSFREPVEGGTFEEAQARAAALNESGRPCPACGKPPRFAVCTEEGFEDRRQFCKRDPDRLRR